MDIKIAVPKENELREIGWDKRITKDFNKKQKAHTQQEQTNNMHLMQFFREYN